MDILDDLKLFPHVNGIEDSLLNILCRKAMRKVRNYIHISDDEELPEALKDVCIELVLISINKLGSEGLKSESAEGINQSYGEDIPKHLKKELTRYRRLTK